LLKEQKKLLKEAGIYLKKRWGQNLLIDPQVLKGIIRLARISPDDTVLEIGSGLGTLTRGLADIAQRVISLELDEKLHQLLKKELGHYPNLQIIRADALSFDYSILGEGLKVVANLPYYISTPIIFRLLEYKNQIKDMHIMLQREVATRIRALPGQKDYSPLSIAVQLYCEVEECLQVSAQAFWPSPRVESSLLRITPLPGPRVALLDEALFFQLVRVSFAQRRKTLRNSLKAVQNITIEPRLLEEAFSKVKIDPRRRGETLALEEWAALSNYLSSKPRI